MRAMLRTWGERMALLQHKPSGKQTINLNGPDGNAWCILGTGQSMAQNLSIDFVPISNEMMSGDYRHLVETFDKHFAKYVDLILPSYWT
jgi:hypothetical protein